MYSFYLLIGNVPLSVIRRRVVKFLFLMFCLLVKKQVSIYYRITYNLVFMAVVALKTSLLNTYSYSVILK